MLKQTLAACALMLLIQSGALAQQEWSQIQKLVADAPEEWSLLGHSAAVDGDVLVLGAPVNEFSSSEPGSAYVFERVGGGAWTEVARLQPAEAQGEARLGFSVAVSGGVIVLGEPFRNQGGADTGGAYVYERQDGSGAWELVRRIRAQDPSPGDLFGKAVAVDGTTIVVGSPEDDDNGDRSGSAYVFEKDAISGAWVEQAKLLPTNGDTLDEFGRTVAIRGDTIAVGAPAADAFGFLAGLVQLFERSTESGGWLEGQIVTSSDIATGDRFGGALALDGSTLLVGAISSDGAVINAGAAYVFEPTADQPPLWVETAKLTKADGQDGDDFGHSVAVLDGLVAVGDPEESGAGVASGAAYLFAKDPEAGVWGEIARVESEDIEVLDRLGWSVAIAGTTLIAGAPFDDGSGFITGFGAGYSFESIGTGGKLSGIDVERLICRNLTTGHGTGHVEDVGWDCEASGLPITPGDTLRVQISGAASGASEISGELINFLVPGVKCRNGATAETVRGPVDGFGRWTCAGFNPALEAGDPVTIQLKGFAN